MNQLVRTLKTGYEMPLLGFGTWKLWDRECVNGVTAALEMGYRCLDTAHMYGNHREVGKALSRFEREDIFVTSKVPPTRLRRDDVVATCEQDLRDLGLDYLDLYLVHWPNPDIPMEEPFAGFAELIDRGLVRSVGVSNFIIERVQRAMDVSEVPVCVNQVEFHPLLYQQELLQYCNSHDVVMTAHCPLARTKAFELEEIQHLAEKRDRTPAQICLRWLVQKGITVIPKSKSPDRIRENMQIFGWELSDEDMAAIDDIQRHHRIRDEAVGNFPD
ncbi:MAG: aldo/keto reductase [Armatimonadota bacterium]